MEEEIQSAPKRVKRCVNTLVIRKMKIMRGHFLATFKNLMIARDVENMRQHDAKMGVMEGRVAVSHNVREGCDP